MKAAELLDAVRPGRRRQRAMRIHPLTLTFPPGLEAEYESANFAKSLPQVRLAIVLGAVLYNAFAVLDAVIVPPGMRAWFWTLRFAVADPALAAVFAFSFFPGFRRHLQASMAALVVLGGLIIIAMTVMAPPPASFSYYAGLILIFIWGYTFTRLRFVWATLAAWFLVACYELAAVGLTSTPLPILVNNNFFFIGANLLGMFAAYHIEYYGRRDFYMARQLAEEREKVEEANRELEGRVRARTEELEAMNEQLRREMGEHARAEEEKRELQGRLLGAEKMEAIGRLAGGVAHDLNNVLNAVVAYPDLILSMLPEDSPQRPHIVSMQRSGLKAAAIVQDLLTLARRGVSVKEILCLNDIVREYLGSAECGQLRVHHPRVGIAEDLDPGLWNIEGSPLHLFKTVMNLVSNAAEALPAGGRIVVTTLNRRLEQRRTGPEARLPDGDHVLLEVADDGIGIAPEDLKRIFEPFFTKKVMGRSGTGLGMAVVWGTVQDHRGTIEVQSVPGKGTTIQLWFPRTLATVSEEGPTVSSLEFMGNRERILVVDDVAEQREVARALLQNLGYAVTVSASGEEAVRLVEREEVDLVILDMIMDPGLDGLDTYRRILEVRPGTRAIIASGFSETERAREAQRLGAGEYIMKPYTLRKIGAAVRAELGERPRRA